MRLNIQNMLDGQNTFGNHYDNFDFSVRIYNRPRLCGAWRCRNQGMSADDEYSV